MCWDDILRILSKAMRFSLAESSRRTQPLKSRKARLKKLVQKLPNVVYVDHVKERRTAFFKLARECSYLSDKET
jgi:hypothetical protein